jgi:hypothetical protein
LKSPEKVNDGTTTLRELPAAPKSTLRTADDLSIGVTDDVQSEVVLELIGVAAGAAHQQVVSFPAGKGVVIATPQ